MFRFVVLFSFCYAFPLSLAVGNTFDELVYDEIEDPIEGSVKLNPLGCFGFDKDVDASDVCKEFRKGKIMTVCMKNDTNTACKDPTLMQPVAFQVYKTLKSAPSGFYLKSEPLACVFVTPCFWDPIENQCSADPTATEQKEGPTVAYVDLDKPECQRRAELDEIID